MDSFRGALRRSVGLLLALVVLFEEWGWAPLAAGLARLARLPLLRSLERWIARLPPWAALLSFGLPALALVPLKLLALAWFAGGHAGWGVALLATAKLVGTAVVARLFTLTQPALMALPWFARWYPRWKRWKDDWLARIRQSFAWRWARVWRSRARWHWRRWVRQSHR